MTTQSLLIDLHERCHRSLAAFLQHARVLSAEEMDRKIDGFGYETVRLQFQHLIGAERYWVSVLRDCLDASEDASEAASIDALAAFRSGVFEITDEYLRDSTDETLAAAREVTVWGGGKVSLLPTHVILRTQTHLFQHMGQIAAMCRLLGHPIPEGMDFPLR